MRSERSIERSPAASEIARSTQTGFWKVPSSAPKKTATWNQGPLDPFSTNACAKSSRPSPSRSPADEEGMVAPVHLLEVPALVGLRRVGVLGGPEQEPFLAERGEGLLDREPLGLRPARRVEAARVGGRRCRTGGPGDAPREDHGRRGDRDGADEDEEDLAGANAHVAFPLRAGASIPSLASTARRSSHASFFWAGCLRRNEG